MVTAGHAPPLHPDKPAVLSFYLGLPVTGLPTAAQGMAARARPMNTAYADFELLIERRTTLGFRAGVWSQCRRAGGGSGLTRIDCRRTP